MFKSLHSLRRLGTGLTLVLVACSPTFDWRDTQFPEADGATALFPCKPDRVARRVPLAGEAVTFALASCSTGGVTFAFGHVQLADSHGAATALAALQAVATANMGGPSGEPRAVHVGGASVEPAARRVALHGRRPDGSALNEEALFFTKGRWVYQASVLGALIDAETADTFFSGIKLPN